MSTSTIVMTSVLDGDRFRQRARVSYAGMGVSRTYVPGLSDMLYVP